MYTTSLQLRAAAELERRKREPNKSDAWPSEYINRETGKVYKPHLDEEGKLVYNDVPRYGMLKGGEGAGKSVAGIIKDLNRLRRKCSGLLCSPDLPHFKKSLWREFRNWCPPEAVIQKQRYRLAIDWQPPAAFELVFTNGATLICGGIENPGSWEGPNVNFAHLDEGRHAQESALKVLDGRCRISGPNDEPPQLWITTTPKKNWLFDYFGPITSDDKFLNFKQNSLVVTLPVELNRENLAPGYLENRRNSLTAAEARVLMEAEWEDETDVDKFVNIIWWYNCQEQLPPLRRDEPMVLAMDAAKGGEGATLPDTFAIVGVTRHPSRHNDVAVRYCGIWLPPPGQLLNYEPIEQEVIKLCQQFSVIEVSYDPYQLHYFCARLKTLGIANFKEFSQQKARLIADKQLQLLIAGRRIAHDGNPLLTQHIDNADAKKGGEDGIRIVKRNNSLKVDATVALSMASARCLYLNLV